MSDLIKTVLLFAYLSIGICTLWFCVPIGYFLEWPKGLPRAGAFCCELLFWPIRLIHTILVRFQE